VSGTIDLRVKSLLDKLYDGLPVAGLDYNLATPDLGVLIPEAYLIWESNRRNAKLISDWAVAAVSVRVNERLICTTPAVAIAPNTDITDIVTTSSVNVTPASRSPAVMNHSPRTAGRRTYC
jgi:hypothetical protein